MDQSIGDQSPPEIHEDYHRGQHQRQQNSPGNNRSSNLTLNKEELPRELRDLDLIKSDSEVIDVHSTRSCRLSFNVTVAAASGAKQTRISKRPTNGAAAANSKIDTVQRRRNR